MPGLGHLKGQRGCFIGGGASIHLNAEKSSSRKRLPPRSFIGAQDRDC